MLNAIRALPKSIFNTALELIYPRFCCICGGSADVSENAPLCETCHKKIKPAKPSPPAIPGRPGFYFDRLHSAAAYEGVMRKCVHKFKYNGMLSLEGIFAKIMADYAEKYIDKNLFDIIIPVPLYGAKLRERSFNQAAILASYVSDKLQIPCVSNNLIRIRAGKSQTDLSKKERLKEIKGAFKSNKPAIVNGMSILLIDDVLTTGATVHECSKTLKLAGARYIEVFTLAQGI